MKWEVRTMRSGTSYFNGTVFKKTVCRFWPLWGAYLVIWLIALPLSGLMLLRMDSYQLNDYGGYMEEFAFSTVPQSAVHFGLVLAVIFGALCAMAVCSHLYSARSANLFGSLPVRREGLFLTHYLAGLCFLLVPNLAIFLLTLAVEAAGGCVVWQGLGFWLAVTCGEGFLFYSMAVFCGLFTGHLLALPLFYGIVNVLAIGITELMAVVLRGFYYGFTGLTEGTYAVVKWLTPAALLDEVVGSGYYQGGGPPELETEGLGVVGIYAVAALALTVCAFLLYRARHMESAGDVVSVKAMRPVFQYGVAFCVGIFFGLGTTLVIGGEEPALMVSIVVWGVIGYFAARMLLEKSFRVFRRWKGAAAVAGVFIALFCVVSFDLTGFETRIPDPSQVDSVYVEGIDAVYLVGDDGNRIYEDITDPALLKLVNILHREAVEQRDMDWRGQAEGVSTTLELTYRLKGGGTLARRYTVWLDPREMNREGTAAWAVQQLYDNRELYWRVYGFDQLEELLSGGGRLESAVRESYNEETGAQEEAVFYGGDAQALLAAVKDDFFAGRIGVRRVDDEENWHGGAWDDSLHFSATGPEDADGRRADVYISIALQDTASGTLAALEGMKGAE